MPDAAPSACYNKQGTSSAVPPVNPVQTAYGYHAQGHLNSEARTGDGASHTYSYVYDGAGRRVSQNIVRGGVTTTYSYDFEDNLTLIASPSGATGYAYDGLNRQGVRSAGGHNHDYALDGDTVLLESIDGTNGSNTLWGAGYLTRWGGEYSLVDGLGNQHLIVDSSHNVQVTCTFSAFGWDSRSLGEGR